MSGKSTSMAAIMLQAGLPHLAAHAHSLSQGNLPPMNPAPTASVTPPRDALVHQVRDRALAFITIGDPGIFDGLVEQAELVPDRVLRAPTSANWLLRAQVLQHMAGAAAAHGNAEGGVGLAVAICSLMRSPDAVAEAGARLASDMLALACENCAIGYNRLGWFDETIAMVDWARTEPLPDKRGLPNLEVYAAEALWGMRAYDEAAARLPKQPPVDIGVAALWRRLKGYIDRLKPGSAEGSSVQFGTTAGSIRERWEHAMDELGSVLTAAMAMMPAPILAAFQERLAEERCQVPQTEAELIRRIEAIRQAVLSGMQGLMPS